MGTDQAKKDLDDYIAGIKGMMSPVSGRTGHMIASMLVGYRTGLYDRAIGRADKIIKKLEGDEEKKALKSAVEVIRNHSVELFPSQKSIRSEFNWEGEDPTKSSKLQSREETGGGFSAGDEKFYAIRLEKDKIKVMQEYERDNALVMAYACAYISSPEDRLPLEEQVLGHVLQRLEFYQR